MPSTPRPASIKRMSIPEIHWVAGILEGEGCFYLSSSKKYPQMLIAVSMVDEDVVRRLYDITGVGRITLRKPPANGISKQDQWQWKVSTTNDIFHLLSSIVPLLGERRRNSIATMVESYQVNKPRPVEVQSTEVR